ncbi:MAG: HEAT repeat domain-containing protein [Planctomycetaceae bacterium]|nr:HEAT repeat domain-containing protein [Planctomycetaceae bacterium]
MFVCAQAHSAHADLVKLKNGGEIRGKLVTTAAEQSRSVSVRTMSGAIVTVSTLDVEFQAKRPLTFEEYELRARLVPETIEDHWELSEWCRENHLSRQREAHLEQMIVLDPEHEIAHRALGHIQRDGVWTTLDDHMTRQGYVKYRGRYITPEEKQLLEQSREERDQQRNWLAQVNLWTDWLEGRRDDQRQQALQHFKEINDPSAIPALQRYLAERPERNYRELFLEVVGSIRGQAATAALVKMAVYDGDSGIRHKALTSIGPGQSDYAVAEFINHLHADENIVVRRAASGLKELGGQKAIPQLIEALVTNHAYRVQVPNPTVGVSLGTSGLANSSSSIPVLPPDLQAGVMTGMIPPENIHLPRSNRSFHWQTVRIDQKNPEVLEALRELTDADFGFDERTWRLWWLSQNS